MPRLDAEAFGGDPAYREQTLRLVREHKAGGFCVFGNKAESVAEAVISLQAEAPEDSALIFSAAQVDAADAMSS